MGTAQRQEVGGPCDPLGQTALVVTVFTVSSAPFLEVFLHSTKLTKNHVQVLNQLACIFFISKMEMVVLLHVNYLQWGLAFKY